MLQTGFDGIFTSHPQWQRFEFFLGLIILPLIGGAGERGTAIIVAREGHAEIEVAVAAGGVIEQLLFLIPVVTLVGIFAGHGVSLIFGPFALGVIGVATTAYLWLARGGELSRKQAVGLIVAWAAIGVAALIAPAG
jgi:Ca2+:H+ antiporter